MAFEISSHTCTLRLDARGRAVALVDRASGYDFLAGQRHSVGLWALGLMRPVCYQDPLPPVVIPDLPYEGHEWFANRLEYEADLALDSDEAPPPEISGDARRLTLNWQQEVPEGAVIVTLTITADKEQLAFRIMVTLPPAWALKRVTFPRLCGFGDLAAPEDDALLYPENWGVLRRNPLEDMTSYTGQYPSAVNWGQLTAWLHGATGLYLGIRDPETHHTGIDVQYVEGAAPAPWNTLRWYIDAQHPSWEGDDSPLADRIAAGREPAIQLRCNHWPEMGPYWECPYPVVLQTFTGDWFEAAKIHRAWALQQDWCRRGPLATRTDASPALAGIDLWFMRYGFHPGSFEPKPAWEFQQAMHTLEDYFQRPFGVHWYHWHNFSWHSTFPTHAPAVEGFAEVVANLQARGIVIMPYCQGRILYRNRPDWEAERTHASIEANGQPYLEKYTPQDDWPLALCPNDPWSAHQWQQAAEMLWRQYGVEGVYFDQISAMPPSLCYHAGHDHPLGGGTQYWGGYAEALEAMQPMIAENPRRFLASELFADAYLDTLDLFLSFVPPLEDYVPLFPAIYSGYTVVMGRATPDTIMKDQQLFVICQGEQFLFGGQLGWMNESILDHPTAAAWLKSLAELRGRVRPILHYGTLEPPLDLRQQGQIAVDIPPELCGKPRPVHLQRPAVRHTHWSGPAGEQLIAFLNEAPTASTIQLILPVGCDADSWQFWLQGATAAETIDGRNELTLTIPALTAAVLVSL